MEIAAIVIAAVGSAGLFNFIQYLIRRKDERTDKFADIRTDLKEIKAKQDVSEKDACRTQMLLLMANYPDQTAELMKLGRHYFVELEADWYMTSLFNGWLKARNIQEPMWLDSILRKEQNNGALE